MTAHEDLELALVPLLRCPLCKAPRTLELRPSAPRAGAAVALADQALVCGSCAARYDVTHDHIPIMFPGGLPVA